MDVPGDLTKPPRSAIVITGNIPVVLSIKYINSRFLGRLGSHLQIEGLRITDRSAPASGNGVVNLTGRDGNPVVRLTWKPAQPSGAVAAGVLPFIALAIVAFVFPIATIAARFPER